jgi:hypothetical protein
MNEFLITTSFARIRRSQSTRFASITYPAVWIVQGPVYGVSVVPDGTPVVSEFGNVRPFATKPPAPEVGGVGVTVGVGAGVAVGVGVGVGAGVVGLGVTVGVGVALGAGVAVWVGAGAVFVGVGVVTGALEGL